MVPCSHSLNSPQARAVQSVGQLCPRPYRVPTQRHPCRYVLSYSSVGDDPSGSDDLPETQSSIQEGDLTNAAADANGAQMNHSGSLKSIKGILGIGEEQAEEEWGMPGERATMLGALSTLGWIGWRTVDKLVFIRQCNYGSQFGVSG
jgi:hypothetical protein